MAGREAVAHLMVVAEEAVAAADLPEAASARAALEAAADAAWAACLAPRGTGRKYSLNFSVQALNLFNNINYGGPNGVLGSPHFNRSTTLAGGIFSTGSAARRIFGQVVFSF